MYYVYYYLENASYTYFVSVKFILSISMYIHECFLKPYQCTTKEGLERLYCLRVYGEQVLWDQGGDEKQAHVRGGETFSLWVSFSLANAFLLKHPPLFSM